MVNYKEILNKAESLGKKPYMTTQFGDKYQAWARITKATMWIHHKPGNAVEVCSGMKLENWLMCHVHAYEYFGGVTRLLIPDNLKTGVTKNTRYETILNRSYQEMAEYYNTAIVPARGSISRIKAMQKLRSDWHPRGSLRHFEMSTSLR